MSKNLWKKKFGGKSHLVWLQRRQQECPPGRDEGRDEDGVVAVVLL